MRKLKQILGTNNVPLFLFFTLTRRVFIIENDRELDPKIIGEGVYPKDDLEVIELPSLEILDLILKDLEENSRSYYLLINVPEDTIKEIKLPKRGLIIKNSFAYKDKNEVPYLDMMTKQFFIPKSYFDDPIFNLSFDGAMLFFKRRKNINKIFNKIIEKALVLKKCSIKELLNVDDMAKKLGVEISQFYFLEDIAKGSLQLYMRENLEANLNAIVQNVYNNIKRMIGRVFDINISKISQADDPLIMKILTWILNNIDYIEPRARDIPIRSKKKIAGETLIRILSDNRIPPLIIEKIKERIRNEY